MNNDIDRLVQEMTELCQASQQRHRAAPSPVGTFLERVQVKYWSLLPWEKIRRHYPTAMTAFVVLGILGGASPTGDGMWGYINWGVPK